MNEFKRFYTIPQIELSPCEEILTLLGSGEADDNDLLGADWNAPDGVL